MKKGNPIALLPIGVFLVLYLGLGLLFEYGLHIPMGFYNIPIVIAFLVSILVACLQNRAVPFEEKLVIMGQGVGDKNIITMLLIFLTAGAFVGVVGRSSAQSVAYFMLDIIPARFAVAVLFVVACFVSTAMGTSVGTITLIMPIALEVAQASGFDMALCAGSVVGGAMFGDNLSFISDTTIAACNGQGCAMRDKFKGNFWIALPAAIATLVLILLLTMGHDTAPIDESYDLIQILPYVLVLAGGVAGINVFIVLLTGIVSGAVIMLLTGQVEATALLASMGNGAGKSTTLNAVAGVFAVDQGTIEIAGVDVTRLPEYKRAKYLGRVFQDPMTGTAATMNIEENMALAMRRGEKRTLRWGISNMERDMYREQLRTLGLGLEERMSSKVGLLSGGQRQALTLLMAALRTPKLLLLDEHTAALDPKTAAKVLELTEKIVAEQKLTAMMVTHNMKDAIAMGNRLIMMNAGRIVVDVRGEEKKKLTREDLMQLFEKAAGQEIENDRMLLS